MNRLIKIEKYLKILIFIALLSLIVFIFSQKIELTSVDLGRHLANGQAVFQDYRVLFTNFYSYTEPNFPFINHHWFSGVIFYAIYLLGGFKLLSLFNIILICLAFSLTFKLARRKANFYLVALLSLPIIFLLSERVEVRPEIISYLFIMFTWLTIDRVEEDKKYRRLLWLLPLFVVWVNSHIYFFIGLTLLGCKFVAEFIPPLFFTFRKSNFDWQKSFTAGYLAAKNWLKILVASCFACLINPNHIKSLLYPFNIFQNYGYDIVENKSVSYLEHLMINYNFTLFKGLLILLIVSWLIYFILKRRLNLFNFLLSIFFSSLALMASRNLAIFALASLILISENIASINSYLNEGVFASIYRLSDKYRWYLISSLLLLIFSALAYLFLTSASHEGFIRNTIGWGLADTNSDSADFFRENKLSGPIFNNYDIGSALIFWLYGQEKVFVDNRPEAYSLKFFSEIYKPMQNNPAKWQEYSDKYKIKTIYFSHTDSVPWAQTFLRYILSAPDWSLVYFDRYTVIIVNKKMGDQNLIKQKGINNLVFRQRLRDLLVGSDLRGKFNLANLALLANQGDLAEEIYRQIIFQYPDNRQALASLAYFYSSLGDRSSINLALVYLHRAIEAGNNLPGMYNEIALLNWRLGLYKKAEANWHMALDLDKNNKDALNYLQQAKKFREQGKIE